MIPNPFSVLIIDSDAASRNYLSATLDKSGYTVLLATQGREGLISAWRDRPNAIIFDPRLTDLTGLELVTRLRKDARSSKVPLLALSGHEDRQEMDALLQAGCNEYLVKSAQTIQKLMELLPTLKHNKTAVRPKKPAKLVAFLSAKGGTGTSSLCANIAMCLASDQSDKKVAVLDLVLPVGSIASIVGFTGQPDLSTAALLSPAQLTAAYFNENLPLIAPWNFHLLAGAPDPESATWVTAERVGYILNAILAAYDFVFVDLGRSLSQISLPVVLKADVLALVVSSDLAAAGLTGTVLEYLRAKGVDPMRIYTIQNRVVGLEGLTRAELEQKLDLPVSVTVPYMSDDFTIANNRHEPLATRLSNETIAILLKQAASQILEMEKPNK